MFEYHALKKKEQDTLEIGMRALRSVLVNVMGLNALRPEDDNGKPKSFDEMSQAEKESFLPMVAWVGRPDMLKLVKEQIETSLAIEKAQSDADYERMVQAIDDAGGDMEPIMGPVPENTATPNNLYKEQLAQLVKQYPGNHDKSESVIDIEDV